MNPFDLKDCIQHNEFNFTLTDRDHFSSTFENTPFLEDAYRYWARLLHRPEVKTSVTIDLPDSFGYASPAQLCAMRVTYDLLSRLPHSLRFSHQFEEKYSFNIHSADWIFYIQRGDELLWLSDVAPVSYFEQFRKKIFNQIVTDFVDLPTTKQKLIDRINNLPSNQNNLRYPKEFFFTHLGTGHYWSKSNVFDMRLRAPGKLFLEINYIFTIESIDPAYRPFNIRVVNIEPKVKCSGYSELLMLGALSSYIDRSSIILNSKVEDYSSEYEQYRDRNDHFHSFKYPL